ncbi:MAG: hypothetical protein QW057_08890 [Candidatus Bathyarchaeia archaeon]
MEENRVSYTTATPYQLQSGVVESRHEDKPEDRRPLDQYDLDGVPFALPEH